MKRDRKVKEMNEDRVESYSGQHVEEEKAKEAERLAEQYNNNNTIALDVSKFNK